MSIQALWWGGGGDVGGTEEIRGVSQKSANGSIFVQA